MFQEFAQLIWFTCSILSSALNYVPNMDNVNIIAISVPDLKPGYEGFNWISGEDQNYILLQNDLQNLNLNYDLDQRMIAYQNFGRDNLVIFYKEGVYTQDAIVEIFTRLFKIYQSYDYKLRLYFGKTKQDVQFFNLLMWYWNMKDRDATLCGSKEEFSYRYIDQLVYQFISWRRK